MEERRSLYSGKCNADGILAPLRSDQVRTRLHCWIISRNVRLILNPSLAQPNKKADAQHCVSHCSHPESNRELRLRRSPLYPFNYGNQIHIENKVYNENEFRDYYNSHGIIRQTKSTLPCSHIVPRNLRPTSGSPQRSSRLIHRSNCILLQQSCIRHSSSPVSRFVT